MTKNKFFFTFWLGALVCAGMPVLAQQDGALAKSRPETQAMDVVEFDEDSWGDGFFEEVEADSTPAPSRVVGRGKISPSTVQIGRPKKQQTEPNELQEKLNAAEEIRDWPADAGQTVRGLLVAWAENSGWNVVWNLDRDYKLEAGVVFRGTFLDVAAALVRSFARANPPPIATFYKGNRVIVVHTREDENGN